MDSGDDDDSFLRAVARAPAVVADELAAGARIGTYRIAKRLGAGGMGVVYLARDESLDRDVAIKVHRGRADLARLEREAIAMAKLAHPNVVAVHGVGEERGRIFVVMEYVAGTTLRDFMRADHTWREIVAMIRAAAAGLAAAHAAGLVHRDFKPENVLIGPDARPRVADFGLVREGPQASGLGPRPEEEPETDPDLGTRGPRPEARGPLTRVGAVMGTPAYMAPEQIRGEIADARADQFALCVTLWEALCGKRPFAGREIGELAEEIEGGRIRRPKAGVPSWLIAICERGLAAEPDARWPSVKAMIDAIDRRMRRRRLVEIGAAALAIAGVGAATIALVPARKASPCIGAGREIDDVWTADARASLRARIVAVVPDGAGVAEHVRGSIDDYTRAYREAAGRVCRAREVEHRWTREVGARSATCLEQARRAIARALRFDLKTPWHVGAMQAGIASLPAPRTCEEPERLPPDLHWRWSPARASISSAIHAAADANDVSSAASSDDRRAVLDRLTAAAEALGDDHALAHIAAIRAQVEELAGEPDQAIAFAERGFELGRKSGFQQAAIDSELTLYRVYALERNDLAKAEPWKVQLLADVPRDPRPDALVYNALASVAAEHAKWDEAIEYARRAVSKVAATEGTDASDYGDALANLATTLDAAGRSAEAIPEFRRAISITTRALGPDTPQLGEVYTNFSIALEAVGDPGAQDAALHALALTERWQANFDPSILASAFLNVGATTEEPPLAIAAFETARHYTLASKVDDRATLALIAQNLAYEYRALGDHARALAEIDRALGEYAAIGDLELVDPINARLLRGSILADADCPAAIEALPPAIADLRRVAPDRDDWIAAAGELGDCLRKTGRAHDARAILEEAYAAAARSRDAVRADVSWALAKVRGDRALAMQARALAGQNAGPRAQARLAEIDRWLAEKR